MPRNGSDARQLVGSLARTSPRDPGRSQTAFSRCLPAPTGASPRTSAAGASAAEGNHLLLLCTSCGCATAPGYVKRTLAGFAASSETFPLKAKKIKGDQQENVRGLAQHSLFPELAALCGEQNYFWSRAAGRITESGTNEALSDHADSIPSAVPRRSHRLLPTVTARYPLK